MEDGTQEKNPRVGLLKENTRVAWEAFYLSFLGAVGIKGAHIAIAKSRDDMTTPALRTKWDEASAYLFYMLCYYTAGNRQAQQVIEKFANSGEGGMADGHSAYKELESVCMGGQGADTTMGQLALLFESSFERLDDVMDMVTDHGTIVRRLRSLPELTIEDIYKGHLLWQLTRCNKAELYQLVDEVCSEDDVSYDQAVTKIIARYQKLSASENPESEFAGLTKGGRVKRGSKGTRDSSKKKEVFQFPPRCFRCGSEAHRLGECPEEPCYDEAPVRRARELGSPAKANSAEETERWGDDVWDW